MSYGFTRCLSAQRNRHPKHYQRKSWLAHQLFQLKSTISWNIMLHSRLKVNQCFGKNTIFLDPEDGGDILFWNIGWLPTCHIYIYISIICIYIYTHIWYIYIYIISYHIIEDRTLHNHHCENLISNILWHKFSFLSPVVNIQPDNFWHNKNWMIS
jgi:hypothetical protein